MFLLLLKGYYNSINLGRAHGILPTEIFVFSFLNLYNHVKDFFKNSFT